jgi:poly(3-hydroxybutyrate) depolymerase
MRLPDNYDNNHPYWLIFGFHWMGGNSKEVDTGGSNGYISAHFGLQKLSNNGAISVAPDELNAGWANSGGQDLKFVDDMIELIEDNYCVDEAHLFANGFSYGGGMSNAIACAHANVFRGVAIYEGAVISGCDGGNNGRSQKTTFRPKAQNGKALRKAEHCPSCCMCKSNGYI